MSRYTDNVAELTPKQRAMLELRLKQMKRSEAQEAASAAAADGPKGEEENLLLADSVEGVEHLLSKFYGRFPWPWPTMKFDFLEDPHFEVLKLNQDVGDWRHRTIPENPKIWVGGCGTNQALQTALRFPTATVVGSDLSHTSLELCGRNARELGVKNLELREESINQVTYHEEFDYVICTGVIHHNAEPQVTLERLKAALKPDGIMELIVYNRYHRIATSSFQKAVRVFGENDDAVDFESELKLAKKIIENVPVRDVLEKGFIQYMDWSESDFADLLIQPVEHSYTVESLDALAESCGLKLTAPCISLYAKSLSNAFTWHLSFADEELQERYDALPDARRWQVTNLMLQEKSPMLWFYLQRKDSARPFKSEKELCREFLETRFERSQTQQRSYIRGADERYELSPLALPYPRPHADPKLRAICDAADARSTMGEIFERLSVETKFHTVNEVRMKLTTTAFPYLTAVAAG